MSLYQSLKIFLLDHISLSKDGFHIFLGFGIYLMVSSLLKIKLSSYKSLAAPVVLGILLEAIDIRDTLVYGERLVLLGNLKDIVTTSFLPLLTTVYLRRTSREGITE